MRDNGYSDGKRDKGDSRFIIMIRGYEDLCFL